MNTAIIFHSFSGITRSVAEMVRDSSGGDLIEVKPKKNYHILSALTMGCFGAAREKREPIDPDTIDVTSYDLIVMGTPVWAHKATPATNAAIAALTGCKGKKAVIFATCGGNAKDTLPIMKAALTARGVVVVGSYVFTKKEIEAGDRVTDMITAIKALRSG